jgi:uncharacterized protein (DUF58 family)
MIATLAGRLRRRAADWAEKRHGRDSNPVVLTRRRIYIVPTRYGLSLALLLLAMLLGSLNYDTSLGFLLTFLLTGVVLVAMHHCHGNLLGLELRCVSAPPVHAGQRAVFRIALRNVARLPRYDVVVLLQDGMTSAAVDLEPDATEALPLEVPTARRGWLALPRFTVASRHPGKLFRAWSWINMEQAGLVYPRLADPGLPLPYAYAPSAGDQSTGAAGDADFVGLRAAVAGDPLHRIAWKAYARNDKLLLKQFAGAIEEPCLLDWSDLPELDREARIEQLARWCVDLALAGRRFGLTLPGIATGLGEGDAHLHECLEALALLPADGRA